MLSCWLSLIIVISKIICEIISKRRGFNKSKVTEFKRENTDDINYWKSSKPLNNPETAAADTRENMIISLFEEKDSIVRKDVETALGVSQTTAVLILHKMINKGVLKKKAG